MPIELIAAGARRQMEQHLSRRLYEAANGRTWFDERQGPINVTVKFDDAGQLLVDLGPGLGELSNTAEMEDLESWLINAADLEVADRFTHRGIVFRFDGKDMYFYHPEERPPPPRRSASLNGVPRIVLSPGHGYYRLYGKKDNYSWVFQRSEQHGVQEDVITMEYAELLQEEMRQRIWGAVPVLARFDASYTHAETKQPWRHISARYYLAWQYPKNPEIWHSLPDDKTQGRERLEDIRSRPFFANHVGAAAAVHLHTNAEPSGTVRGTRVYYHRGSPESKKLADRLLCGMKEIVRSLPRYEDFPMDEEARNDGNYGENRLAAMPSALVELAFHSNKEDAAALLDDDFKKAVVSGLTKGFKLYREGAECEPFMVELGEGYGYTNHIGTVTLSFKGYPRTPVDFHFEEFDCGPSATACINQYGSRYSVSSPMYYPLRCPNRPGPHKYRLTMTDADGVISNAAEGEINCKFVDW